MTRLRIAACQIDAVVGGLDGNVERICAALAEAEAAGADLAVFPELAITGYPPEDLLLKPGFVAENLAALERVAAATGRCAAVVGFVDSDRELYNAAAVCADGEVRGVYRKRLLPNYAVFDEQRYFSPRTAPPQLFEVGGVRVGISVCEDGWDPTGAIAEAAAGGAELVVNLNASPFHAGKQAEREAMFGTRAADAVCPVVYVNMVGGQDELVFDGGSFVAGADSHLIARAPQFSEHTLVVDVEVPSSFRARLADARDRPVAEPLEVVPVSAPVEHEGALVVPPLAPVLDPLDEIYQALVVGTRDYVRKNGFTDVVIGLSGGVDSALVAAIAADALGAAHVHGVLMPSRFSSDHSVSDAVALAENLGIDHRTIGIEPAHTAMLEMVAPSFEGLEPGLAEENVQSRIRGMTLMALSNKLDWMVLTTGNKTESAVGYTTLYGDTAGGYAVIKDIVKMTVYALCRRRNERAGRELIPEAILTKAPSAELRPDQTDDQSLPPYPLLDQLVELYVEDDHTAAEIVDMGYDAEVVARVTRLVDVAEYKRRQSPPGVRVSRKAFGKDRRLPITNHYRG
ncbi:MAG: NAD+ synthase [Acidimicrobiales bacterium]